MKDKNLQLVVAQINVTAGDLVGNFARIQANVQQVAETQPECDLIVFPELALTGTPLHDIMLRDDLFLALAELTPQLAELSQQKPFLLGHPVRLNNQVYRAVSLYAAGKLVVTYRQEGTQGKKEPKLLAWQEYQLGLLLGDELESPAFVQATYAAGADLFVAIQASPYDVQQQERRQHLATQLSTTYKCPFVYVNCVGGQDSLLYDGCSFALDSAGQLAVRLAHCEEQLGLVQMQGNKLLVQPTAILPALATQAATYQALVLAVRDYVNKNGFPGVILGLSGGIDSALVLALAVDALGAERVQAVMMPYTYTATISIEDAKKQAQHMGASFEIVPIEPMVNAFMQQLAPLLPQTGRDTTEENIQARCRGMLLMALSNKSGRVVLSTGNKSELAVGYCTLYGDMCGGFAPLKDVPKTLVYELARYRNTLSAAIPERVITRPPSAELAPDQKDEDSLPPYDILDAIIAGYVEHNLGIAELLAQGLPEEHVLRVIQLIERNEYKRQQGALGPKITTRSFSPDRAMPVTQGYYQTMLALHEKQ